MKTLTDFRKTVETAVWHESTPGTGQIVGTLLKWIGVANRFRPSLITSY